MFCLSKRLIPNMLMYKQVVQLRQHGCMLWAQDLNLADKFDDCWKILNWTILTHGLEFDEIVMQTGVLMT